MLTFTKIAFVGLVRARVAPPSRTARALSSMAEMEASAWRDIDVAASYAQLFAPLTAQSAAPLLAAAGMEEPARGDLLDACCGAGLVLRCAHAGASGGGGGSGAGLRSVGLDFSAAMLADARAAPELSAAAARGDVAFFEGDACALPFPDASFDAVTCAYGVLHLPTPEAFLAEARAAREKMRPRIRARWRGRTLRRADTRRARRHAPRLATRPDRRKPRGA